MATRNAVNTVSIRKANKATSKVVETGNEEGKMNRKTSTAKPVAKAAKPAAKPAAPKAKAQAKPAAPKAKAETTKKRVGVAHLLTVKVSKGKVSGEYINTSTGEARAIKVYKSPAALVAALPGNMGKVSIAFEGEARTSMLRATPEAKEFWAEVGRARARRTYVAIQL